MSRSTANRRRYFSLFAAISVILSLLPGCIESPGSFSLDPQGEWGPILALPTSPEQMVVLPSGKVLMWPWAPERRSPVHGPLALWNPVDGSSIAYPGSQIESGSGLAFQPNGTLLSAGGDMPNGGVDGNPRSFTFDYVTETLSEVASMPSGRVAPSATTLGSGEILLAGGWGDAGHTNPTMDLWDGNRWTQLPHTQDANGINGFAAVHFLDPDGRLFRAGPERLTDWLDLATGAWEGVEAERRNQVRFHGSTVMYDEGKILYTGGCPVGPERGWDQQCADTVLASAEVIDLMTPSPSWRPVPPMTTPRHSHHSTLLPDGRVLITGGSDQPLLFHDESVGVLLAEVWDPINETFSPAASMGETHHFHSTAVLLRDGRVFVAGGRFGPSGPHERLRWSGQIYTPDYLNNGSRPEVSGAPESVEYSSRFRIDTPDPEKVNEVVLMGLSTSRAGWNSNQRRVPLDFTLGQGMVQATSPSNPNIAPPGFYWLFLLNKERVPSIGMGIQVIHRE